MSGAPAFKITVLGSGTSVGVPTVGCHCAVCSSEDPRDKRLRPSMLVAFEGRNVLIDTTPDFRTQILRARVDRLDAVIYTHAHADHIMGLDDVRPFNFRQGQHIPIYASAGTLQVIRRAFAYIFEEAQRTTYVPQLGPPRSERLALRRLPACRSCPSRILHGQQPSTAFASATPPI